MKALTLHQPWALAVFLGKDIENRTWMPPPDLIGQRFAIHAARRVRREEEDDIWEDIRGRLEPAPPFSRWARGKILGTVKLEKVTLRRPMDCSRADSWFTGPVGWVLAEPRLLKRAIPARGYQRLWDVEAAIARELNREEQA
jgi:hypothetical protein